MLILQGTLRQVGEVSFSKDRPKPESFLKLWVEHETPRDTGPADLAITELLIPKADVPYSPQKGETVSVVVRCYVAGRDLAFKAISLLQPAKTAPASK